jgi:methionyl-tRNA formyltransferase
MRIVFFGASTLGHRCCRDLLERGQEVVGIVSMREEFEISYSEQPVRNATYQSFEDLAEEFDVPLLYVERRFEETHLDWLGALEPSFGLAIGWYYLIPRAVRELFPQEVAGIHASLLPQYRGGAPLVWALINGEHETGVSLFYLDEGADVGDIITQRTFPIAEKDTIANLLEKAQSASLEVLREALPLLSEQRAPRIVQDEARATTFPQRSPEDGEINWGWDSDVIERFIRAQTHPYPGAWTSIGGKRVTIWSADVNEQPPPVPT